MAEVAGARPLPAVGTSRKYRGCGRHAGVSVAAAAVAAAAAVSRRFRSRHWRKHRPAALKHGNKGGAWQQQWATGTESAERRGYRATSLATPGVGMSEPAFSARDAQRFAIVTEFGGN